MDEGLKRTVARRALPLVDLTNLDDGCTADDVSQLCRRAITPYGTVAAICIWPWFVDEARGLLENSPVRIATVVNFPDGNGNARTVLAETKKAVADGADEIDLVIPYKSLMAGDEKPVRDMVSMVRAATDGSALLKVIIEAGVLDRPDLITLASKIALEEGADFIKTSTGKVAVNATPANARTMLEALKDHGDATRGFKPAGGIRTVEDAAQYLALADALLGANWAGPETFRFGASSLLDALLAALGDAAAAANDNKSGY